MATGLSGSSQAEAARERMQEKSFRAWINLHLAKNKLAVQDLTTDFADGVKLIKLVETISEEPLGKYHKNPVSKIQKIENLNLPLKYINNFVASIGIKNSYSAENVLEEDRPFILGMVWTLILRFAIAEISEGDMTAKEGLLLWAKKKVKEGSNGTVEVTNFHTSWQNGMAFNALINAFRPDLLDFKSLGKDNKLDNLNQAFDISDTHLGIPKILDAEDMVAMRPDEKSVMTYVSLFWKEFAANKRRGLAGDRIGDVVRREQALEDMTAQYVNAAEELQKWVSAKSLHFEKEAEANSSEEAESELLSFFQYGRSEKPKKHSDLMELQALASSIETRLFALGRSFNPPEHVALPKMQKWWEDLTEKEIKYEEKLKAKLRSLKKVELLIKLFNSRSGKLEDWMGTKSAWLQVRQKILRVSVIEGEMAPRLSRSATSSFSREFGSGDGMGGSQSSLSPNSRRDSQDGGKEKPRTSFMQNVSGFFSKKPDKDKRVTTEDASPQLEKKGSTGVSFVDDEVRDLRKAKSFAGTGHLRGTMGTSRSMSNFANRLDMQEKLLSEAGKTADAPDGGLDSASKVQAKLNMFAAYEDELKGRTATIEKLNDLVQQAIEAGCPPFRQFSLQNRVVNIKDSMDELKEAGDTYKEGLEVEYQRQLRLEEMRVNFAKQAEALNRWIEEGMDMLTEVLQATNVEEAQAELASLDKFSSELARQQVTEKEIAEFAQSMKDEGIVANPYCRFSLPTLQDSMRDVADSFETRRERLQQALSQQQTFDEQKRAFAKEAEQVVAKVGEEKAAVDSLVKAGTIAPDDAEAISKGKQVLVQLQEISSLTNRERRTALCSRAQEINDALVEEGELDNTYTRETVASLKSQVEVFETRLRDKMSFIEAQLTRAQADISVEQYAEIKSNFAHFDKSGDDLLIKDEFSAAIKSLDLELTPEEEEKTFVKFARDGEGEHVGKSGINLESFTTFMLQQLKAKDTLDALLDAFSTVSGGKDFVTAEDLHKTLGPEEAKFLLSRMDGLDLGMDYKTFSQKVFGVIINN